jgi:Protein of unknown function (DUF4231)
MTANPGSRSSSHAGDDSAWQLLGDRLPQPADPAERADVLWQELAALFRWYGRAATSTRLSYQVIKVAVLVIGAAVTVLAATRASSALTAALAASVVVLEGIQQLFQFQSNWITYRGTAEAMRQQAFLYVAQAGPYADTQTRRERLAEFMTEITAKESAGWASTLRRASSAPNQT